MRGAAALASPLPAPPLSCVVTDVPKCFSPEMVPPCPDQVKRQTYGGRLVSNAHMNLNVQFIDILQLHYKPWKSDTSQALYGMDLSC